MNLQIKNQVYSRKESWMLGRSQYKFRTVVSEVSSFVGNCVSQVKKWLFKEGKN